MRRRCGQPRRACRIRSHDGGAPRRTSASLMALDAMSAPTSGDRFRSSSTRRSSVPTSEDSGDYTREISGGRRGSFVSPKSVDYLSSLPKASKRSTPTGASQTFVKVDGLLRPPFEGAISGRATSEGVCHRRDSNCSISVELAPRRRRSAVKDAQQVAVVRAVGARTCQSMSKSRFSRCRLCAPRTVWRSRVANASPFRARSEREQATVDPCAHWTTAQHRVDDGGVRHAE